jgi:uncharacterized protein
MTNVEVVTQLYADFAVGNIPGILGMMDPAAEWTECQGMPFVQGSGVYVGPEAILNNVFMQLGNHIDGFNVAVNTIFGDGDKVAMQGYYQGTNKVSGHPFKANACHIWTFNDGKITHFFQAVDTVLVNR